MGGPYGSSGLNTPLPLDLNSFANTQLSFLAMLELPDLSWLTNNPILHNLYWPTIFVKIPIDILNFVGKTREDPIMHITTYHLWCVSNSLLDDSMHIQHFPHTLTNNTSKCFIELLSTLFNSFSTLEIAFLMHF